MQHCKIDRAIGEIVSAGDFSRRLPEGEPGDTADVAKSINLLLECFERNTKDLESKLAVLSDARDDAQTTSLLLRRAKDELRDRGNQLDIALQRAALASTAKSQFLASMSHEIRTPLNGIIGMAELLSRADLLAKQQRQVGTILGSGRALLTVINDILDFSKVESGKFELDEKPFNLHTSLGDIVELLTTAARQKSLDLTLKIAPDLPQGFVGDAGRIRQIVTNLVGNAVKFTDHGSVTVSMSGNCIGDIAELSIEVADTGIGIPPEKIASIFEAFSQVDQTCTRRHDGTGLGLSICKLLAARMNGQISATSELGIGSVFRFDLLLPVDRELKKDIQPALELRGKKLLLIGADDDLKLAIAELSGAGCIVSSVPSFPDLVSAHSKQDNLNSFDILLMAQCSISESLVNEITALRSDPIGCRIPILVLSTIGSQGDAKLLTDAGVQGYITGPFDADVLVQSLQYINLGGPGNPVTKHMLAETLGRKVACAPAPEKSGRKASVLIVDDSLVNREVARDFLDEIGCEIEFAVNGKEAVERAAFERFDLILMDCQMPVMDGFTATERIRKNMESATSREVPIIALTANAFASDREKCQASGMTDFLSKPFLPSEFDALVRKWLAQSEQHP